MKLATYGQKAKFPGLSPAASYVRRPPFCSNGPANVYVSVKRVELVKGS